MELWGIATILAILELDITAVGQFMVCRPIVVGTIIGALCGNVCLGLGIGALIELIWIGQLPVGNVLPLDTTLLTGLVVFLTDHISEQTAGNIPAEALFTLALAASIPLAYLSTLGEGALRKQHSHWVHLAQRFAQEGKFRRFNAVNYLVLVEMLVKNFIVALSALYLMLWVGKGILMLPAQMLMGLKDAHWFLLALGCAAAIDLIVEKKRIFYLLIPAIVAGILVYFFQAPAIYLLLMAFLTGLALCYRTTRESSARALEDRPEDEPAPRIPFLLLFQAFIRSFYIQTVWNFERGLNYGAAFILSPLLKHYFPPEERSRALVRHLDYFNTQPYMASFIMGAVIRMEAERAKIPGARQKQKEEEISALKLGMTSPLAAVGDSLFWATVRPYCGLIAVSLVFAESFHRGWYHFLIPAVFLLVYNSAHLSVRLAGLLQGFRLGDQVVSAVRRYGFQDAVQSLRTSATVLLGVLIVVVNYYEVQKGFPLFALKMIFFAGLLGLFTYLFHKKISASYLFYGVVLLALILAYWPELSASPGIMDTPERSLQWLPNK